MRIFLADLGHNQLTYSSDVYPLGIANLAMYVREYARNGGNHEIRLFREPQDLRAALEDGVPDVLALSSYSWNHELSSQMAAFAKAREPGVLTLMGGPNFPLDAPSQEAHLRAIPQVDVAVRGPTYEGERAFLQIIERFDAVGGRLEGVFEGPVPGNMWIDPRTDEFVVGEAVPRIDDLDEIPSPYLAGLLDPYFETGYFPLMQIARGCPFSCQFCNSSVLGNSKIHAHSVENVKADLRYVADRVQRHLTLCFADDNFGMYPRDEEIADYLGWLQDTYDWPMYIRTTTGKNKHERIIRVMRKTKGAMPMTAAVQSMNPTVLANIKRSNIKLESYAAIQEELRSQGMQSYGELILGLPGETKDTFLGSIHDLLESGVKRVSAHQLMLLPGAPLSTPAAREQHGFKTRFRVVARNIGRYFDEPSIEVEEMVVESDTLSFDDYLHCRVFHLLLTIYYYEGNFEEAFEFARQKGVKGFDLLVRMQAMLDGAPDAFRAVIDEFVDESQEELFESREACLAWARDHFDALVDGTVGGNLLSKYSLAGRFYATHAALDFLRDAMLAELPDLDDDEREALHTVIEYLRAVQLTAPFGRSLEETPGWTSRYDVESWREGGFDRDLSEHRFERERRFSTSMEPRRRELIESRIETFGERPSQMGKFTRTMFAQDLRRSLVPAAGEA